MKHVVPAPHSKPLKLLENTPSVNNEVSVVENEAGHEGFSPHSGPFISPWVSVFTREAAMHRGNRDAAASPTHVAAVAAPTGSDCLELPPVDLSW